MKIFTALTTTIKNDKVIAITASNGASISNSKGLSLDRILDWFFELRCKKDSDEVFICYASQSDNEYIFSSLPSLLKDKLFQSYSFRKERGQMEQELEDLDYQFFQTQKDSQEFQELDFERYVEKLALKELNEIKYNDYTLYLINGKILTVTKNKIKFILYDVYGFFRTTLSEAIEKWLKERIGRVLPAKIEAEYISKLQSHLHLELLKHGIKLSKFHGVTTISTWLLSKTKARTEYHSYKRRSQYSGELYRAVMQGYYGGRTEQFKIGTFNEPIYVYDINSAYAFACSKLPILRSKPIFTQEYNSEPFSVWHCNYDFTNVKPYFGLLPNRDSGNGIKYKLRGKGYFWQPEIDWILKNYPECIKIDSGFFVPYKQANFTQGIIDLYNLRVELQQKNDPLEKILGLALSAIYGKFCQREGAGYYYNMMYAGYITSHTRAQLLDATKQNEKQVICFLTDAIHTQKELPIIQSNKLGDYKRLAYLKSVYLDNGVYRLYGQDGNIIKEASKGFREFNFDAALAELQGKRSYTALAEFFIGHNLHSFMPVRFREYLKVQKENKKTNPFELSARLYESVGIDLTANWCESKALDLYSGRESAMYSERYYKEADVSKDSLMSGRI